MGIASYEIVGAAGEWRVSHDGLAANVYQTRESAFEAAVAAASLALRQGHEVWIMAFEGVRTEKRKAAKKRAKR